jgi:hypothetical protein
MTIEFGQLVAQLHGTSDTRYLAATVLLRDYNMQKKPYLRQKVNEILSLQERAELLVGRWDTQTLYPHPQAIRWQD